MQEEINSLQENETWTLCELPEEKKSIGSKWVFKKKIDANGTSRYKARLVAQGFSQKYGEDYDEVFAPVCKQSTFRALLTVASHHKMHVHHLDVKTAFLNGQLNEIIYMKQPSGFIAPRQELVCKLNRSLYGLKQSARVWNNKLNTVLESCGFQRGKADSCLYSKKVGSGCYMYVLVYVDDLILACTDEKKIKDLFQLLSEKFTISDLGNLKMFLGIEIEQDENVFHIHQARYVQQILKRFGLEQAKPAKTPMDTGYLKEIEKLSETNANKEIFRQVIGSLLYVSTCTRPDIAFSVSILSRKVENPNHTDWTALKRVMRYLKGTVNYKLCLSDKSSDSSLIGYADADWAGDKTDRKSNSGFIFKWFGGPINWASRKQSCVSLSSTEAEYIALTEACQEALWLQKLFQDFNYENSVTTIFEDNQSTLHMLKTENFNRVQNRTKHIDTKFHFVKDLALSRNFVFEYCATEFNIADILTKPLNNVKNQQLLKLLKLST